MHRYERLLAAFAIVAPVVATTTSVHASVDAVVAGIVDDALLHPLKGATVVLHDSAGNTVASTVTVPRQVQLPGDPVRRLHGRGDRAGPGRRSPAPPDQLVADRLDRAHAGPGRGDHPDRRGLVRAAATTGHRQRRDGQSPAAQREPGGDDRPITDVVATQPGFVTDALGNIYARGNHANIQYQVDGIPVPDSVGSLFAASIPVRLVSGLEIYTGGMPAEFGDRLGAVVNLTTRSAGEHPTGNVQVRYGSFDTIEPGATYSTKLGDTAGIFGGGSLQYSQRALDPPSIYPILHDTGYTGRLFTRVDWAPCDVNRYELFATYGHNRFQIPIDPSVDPLTSPGEVRPPDQFGNVSPPFVPHDTNASETEDELFVAASWTHRFDRGQLLVAPLYKLSRGVLFGDAEHALGPTVGSGHDGE